MENHPPLIEDGILRLAALEWPVHTLRHRTGHSQEARKSLKAGSQSWQEGEDPSSNQTAETELIHILFLEFTIKNTSGVERNTHNGRSCRDSGCHSELFL
jgi:hypothetical protein